MTGYVRIRFAVLEKGWICLDPAVSVAINLSATHVCYPMCSGSVGFYCIWWKFFFGSTVPWAPPAARGSSIPFSLQGWRHLIWSRCSWRRQGMTWRKKKGQRGDAAASERCSRALVAAIKSCAFMKDSWMLKNETKRPNKEKTKRAKQKTCRQTKGVQTQKKRANKEKACEQRKGVQTKKTRAHIQKKVQTKKKRADK